MLIIDGDASGAPIVDVSQSDIGVTIDDLNRRILVDDIVTDSRPQFLFSAPLGTIAGSTA